MDLTYKISWFTSDPAVCLRWMNPGVQRTLEAYNGKLQSLSVIPDGNRRLSRKFHMPTVVEWHKQWVARIEETLIHLRQKRSNIVDEVTFWWLSRENKNRPPEELEWLYGLLREFSQRLYDIAKKEKIHVFAIWDENLIPDDINKLMGELSTATMGFNELFRCALLLGYDMEWEISRQADLLAIEWFTWSHTELRKEANERGHRGLRSPNIMIRAWSDNRHRTSGGFVWPNTAMHFFRAHWPTITSSHIDFALHRGITEQINNGK